MHDGDGCVLRTPSVAHEPKQQTTDCPQTYALALVGGHTIESCRRQQSFHTA